jgi:hypothetical protein
MTAPTSAVLKKKITALAKIKREDDSLAPPTSACRHRPIADAVHRPPSGSMNVAITMTTANPEMREDQQRLISSESMHLP